jgi:shikimate kinase/3-dehydroquinate synthase
MVRGRKTVWLVGMMGAGKSAVGEALARRLGRRFVDTDAEIERESGAGIPEIFRREGEVGFRRREVRAIEGLGGEDCVAALGGGAIAQPGAAERLAASGIVVYLRARPESLLGRIGNGSGRPLLEEAGPGGGLERLEELLRERGPHYETAAIVVDTDDRSVEEVVEALVAELAERPA